MQPAYAHFRPRGGQRGNARRLTDRPSLLQRLERASASVQEEFRGITATGALEPGLFELRPTGFSTEPIRAAAEAYLASLNDAQREAGTFPLESDAWRSWSNIHPFMLRHGLCLEQMTEAQRDLALGLLRATLSQRGYETSRDVMRLNDFIGEITGYADEYGEWLYWMSVMGTPSEHEPWGWQIDGHHLIVNCLVLGDQIVVSPTFLGSEPVECVAGRYAGIRVFAEEEAWGDVFLDSLTDEQRARATIGDKPHGEIASAFCDNLVLPYEGLRYSQLSAEQQTRVAEILERVVGQIRPGHAGVRLEEVKRHLGETYFASMGPWGEERVFYYRIHNPVILIELDHQAGIALDNTEPTRNHIHLVMRTPNGNDYGKDLLRQHHARFRHVNGAHVPR
jgi:hypothetical protein